MTYDYFHDHRSQLDSLTHKRDEANEDIFRDQAAQLHTLFQYQRRSAREMEKRPPSKMLAPKAENKINYFYGMGHRIFVVSAILFFLIMTTLLGGIVVVEIERHAEELYVPFPTCFQTARANNYSTENALNYMEKCIKESHNLTRLQSACLFSWSLYATVGYGHRYPFTFYSQLFSVFYAWFFIPIYIALKIEFGEILAINILFFGSKLKKVVIRFGPECITKTMKQQRWRPSDMTLVAILLVFFSSFILLLSVLIMYTSRMSYWEGFYLTMHTVFQVGLGDITPMEEWSTFVFFLPLVFFGDTLASFLHYYVHGIYRLQMHRLALCVTGCHVQDAKEVPEGEKLVMAKNVADFMTVTNLTMPLRATTAEIPVKEESPGTAEEGKKETTEATSTEDALAERTQRLTETTQYSQISPWRNKAMRRVKSRPKSGEKSAEVSHSAEDMMTALLAHRTASLTRPTEEPELLLEQQPRKAKIRHTYTNKNSRKLALWKVPQDALEPQKPARSRPSTAKIRSVSREKKSMRKKRKKKGGKPSELDLDNTEVNSTVDRTPKPDRKQ